MTWHIKKRDGTLFGPVELPELREWAAQGRIAPDDQLSQDRQFWVDAPDVPALEMDWLVHLPGGQVFGPINPLALRDPLGDGTLAPDAILVHRRSSERRAVLSVVLDALGAALNHARTEAARPAAPAAQPGEIERLREQLSAAEAERDQWQQRCSEEQARAAAAPGPAVAAPTTTPPELARSYEELTAQLRLKTEELQTALAARDGAEQAARERLAQTEEALRLERETSRRLMARLNEIESAHLALVRSFRELHERVVNLRQPPAPAGKAEKPRR